MSKGMEALEIVKTAMLSSGNCLLNSLWDYTDVIEKELKALEIIKECLVAEFSLHDKGGEYFIVFHFDGAHELTFKLKDKIEYDLLKEVLWED